MRDERSLEVTKEELAKSIAIYVAGEAEISEKVSPEEAGRRGAFLSDLAEVGERYVKGEISQEEVEKEVTEKTVAVAISPFVEKAVDFTIEVITKIVEEKIPAVGKIIKKFKEPLKTFVKEKVLDTAKKVVNKAWKKVKLGIKKLFGG